MVGRMQIFNNWSPYMVADQKTSWIRREYFVNEGDKFWTMSDKAFAEFAMKELELIGIIDVKKGVVKESHKRLSFIFPTHRLQAPIMIFPNVRLYRSSTIPVLHY